MKMMLIVFGTLFVVYYAYTESTQEDLGSPLFLTPHIESGDVETGREMALVNTTMLQGLDEDIESYSGFLTVDKENHGNMFFWFFPAEEDAEDAPLVIWLQGGPGLSAMLGVLKLHGPIITKVDTNNQLTGVDRNPYSWSRRHNMLYIDNPVGAGNQEKETQTNIYRIIFQDFLSVMFFPPTRQK